MRGRMVVCVVRRGMVVSAGRRDRSGCSGGGGGNLGQVGGCRRGSGDWIRWSSVGWFRVGGGGGGVGRGKRWDGGFKGAKGQT